MSKHRWIEALDRFSNALVADEEKLGSDHYAVAYDHFEIGNALAKLERVDEAREHYQYAQAIAEGSADQAGSLSVVKRVGPALIALNRAYDNSEFQARWENQMQWLGVKREPPRQ